MDEVFDLRVVLEGHAAELSAPTQDSAGLTRANHAFHNAIISTASNQRLAAMIASVVEISWVSRTFSIYSDADLAANIAHHREMIHAFSVRDGVWAAAIMRAHIRAGYHVFALSHAPSDPPGPCRREI